MLKKYIAIIGALCAISLTVVVALRIAPEAWAVIAGIFFGGLASVPMCFIALMLLRRQPLAPMQPSAYQPQPQVIIMREPALPRRQPQSYIPPAPQPQYHDEDYVEGDYQEYEQPAATPRPAHGTQVVNQQPTSVRIIGGRG
ncbi:MAG: hypothetical protein DLM69_06755 [Candidatus Chloroheliales bacterium]|nr:MAG: hypothetical protein DLM69_06755 [Chloroflexota bacterium]